MAYDRFVYFKEESPTLKELKKIIEDYLDGAGTIEFSNEGLPWFICTLHGKPSHPMKRIRDILKEEQFERWFEVVVNNTEGEKCKVIDVLTRLGDFYTNTVADGLVKIFEQFYNAQSEGN